MAKSLLLPPFQQKIIFKKIENNKNTVHDILSGSGMRCDTIRDLE
jgi:hypothetical protein